ncbi:MAG: cupredoxin domain-containing protein [Rhizomicrobium sp.]
MIKFAGILSLMLVPLGAMGQAMAQGATPLTVTLTDYAFSPATLDLKAGTTYRLHFVNSGSKDHNFSAPEFFVAAQIAPDDQAKVIKGQVGLGASQAVDITVTPGGAGTYAVECTHFMHKMMGMHGNIVVQ